MNEYLKTTLKKFNSEEFSALHVVLGNESCDLDSAVSSLAYAAFLHWQHQKMLCRVCTRDKRIEPTKDDIFLPLLNVESEDYELKTEVVYCLHQHGIHKENLLFRDHPMLQSWLSKADVILVDHHVLAKQDAHLTPLVSEIIDHRPTDKTEWSFRVDTRSTLEVVGSCATLVTQRIRDLSGLLSEGDHFFTANTDCCDMLHSTIILDTVNFSTELNKGTPHDMEVVLFLEGILAPADCETERANKLSTLVSARGAVHTLSATQLLRKDAKLLGDILVPSFPILVQEFLRLPDALTAVSAALGRLEGAGRGSEGAGLLLGMQLAGGLRRDVAVYCSDRARRDQLCTFLLEWKPSLDLSEHESVDQSPDQSLRYFQQLNLSASRKQYMPALKEFLNRM